VIGLAHRLFIVLDDDYSVAEIAKLPERCQQPRVVALVQSNRRLVEDVENTDKTRSNLCCETNTLRFAA
jgi:hypothetical protein